VDQRYLFFGGKGGVGKTTCAAAKALCLGKEYKTLIISTDPAHSLSDSFGVKIGSEETHIIDKLYAVEISAKKLGVGEGKTGEVGESGLEPGAGGDMMSMFGDILSDPRSMEMPGMDEYAALLEFTKYIESDYEKIIFDTAPTGHTLRLLTLPDMLDSWIGKLIKIRLQMEQFMGMIRGLFGNAEEDKSLEALEDMKKRLRLVKSILTGPETSFTMVMIPEQMSVFESERYIKTLLENDITVGNIIVNRMTPESDCEFCAARWRYQLENLDEIRKRFAGHDITLIPLFKEEIIDIDKLEKVCGFVC